MRNPLLVILSLLLLAACQQNKEGLSALDLAPHGLPIVILAPDSATVQVKDYNFMRDITVRQDSSFFLQIFEFAAPKLDAAGEKLRQLTAVHEDPFFKEVIREDEQGFIFTRQSDSTALEYDFRYVRILGDKELIFQTGLVGTFSLEDVERMYVAIQE